MKKYFLIISAYLLITIISVVFAQNILSKQPAETYESSAIYVKAIALEVENSYSGTQQTQKINFEIKFGPDKDRKIEVEQVLMGDTYDIEVAEGDKMMLYGASMPSAEIDYQYYVQDYYHLDFLIVVAILFVMGALILGGKSGVKALFSLGISLVMIFEVLIPLAKAGFNPVLLAVFIGSITAVFAITIIQGFNISSITAVSGTIGGLLISALIAGVTIHLAKLTGLSTEDSRMLALYYPELSYDGLFLAGIMVGALGAIMDISISISAGLIEIKKHKKNITSTEMMSSGFNIGRDIMGSMMNTLIFAYVGASLTIIMLFYGSGTSLVEILNYGFISEEIGRSLVGSFGLLATIPITAIVGGVILGNRKT